MPSPDNVNTSDKENPNAAALLKVSMDAFGYRITSAAGEGRMSAHFEQIKGAATHYIDEEDANNSYYVIEFAIPALKENGDALTTDSLLYFSTQINSIDGVEFPNGEDQAGNGTGFKYTKGAQNGRPNATTGELNSYAGVYLVDTTPDEVDESCKDELPTREDAVLME